MIIIKEEKTKLKHKKSDKEVWRGGSRYGEETGTLVARKGLEMEGSKSNQQWGRKGSKQGSLPGLRHLEKSQDIKRGIEG